MSARYFASYRHLPHCASLILCLMWGTCLMLAKYVVISPFRARCEVWVSCLFGLKKKSVILTKEEGQAHIYTWKRLVVPDASHASNKLWALSCGLKKFTNKLTFASLPFLKGPALYLACVNSKCSIVGMKDLPPKSFFLYSPFHFCHNPCHPSLYALTYLGLSRTICIQCVYGIFGRETNKRTVIYVVCIWFWPTLHIFCVSTNATSPFFGLESPCGCCHSWPLLELNQRCQVLKPPYLCLCLLPSVIIQSTLLKQ